MKLAGVGAIVTGASRGVGEAIADRLAREGCPLLLVARDAATSSAVAGVLRARYPGNAVETLAIDLTDLDAPHRIGDAALSLLGGVGLVVNNAAVWRSALLVQQDDVELSTLLATNLLAPIRVCRHLLPGLLERGRGHIVNISSIPGRQGMAYNAAYSASKAGLLQFTNALRSELRGSGVSASTVLPSFVGDTGMSRRHGVPAPFLVGGVSAARVAGAVVRCVERDRPEIIVSALPVRPLLALVAAFPALAGPLVRRMGIDAFHRVVAEVHARDAGGGVRGG